MVVPHFDNHPLLDLCPRAVVRFLSRGHRVSTVINVSPDLNPTEHLSDIRGHKINQRNPPFQTVTEFKAALHQDVVRTVAHGAIGRRIDNSWCNKCRGICYHVYGLVYIKEPLLLNGMSSPCGDIGFPLSLSEWSFTIYPMPYSHISSFLLYQEWALVTQETTQRLICTTRRRVQTVISAHGPYTRY